MNKGNRALVTVLLAASALIAPQTAWAGNTKGSSSIEARLAKLEAEMNALRGDLGQAQAETEQARQRAEAAEARAASAEAANAAASKRLAVLETKPAPAPAAQADGIKSGATTIKLGGYIKMLASSSHYSEGEVATNSLGRDFYLPQSIPTGTGPASHVSDFTAKQSRFWMNLSTDVAGHAVKAYVEADFQVAPGTQGSQRTTNGYDLGLRRAYMQVDRWTFGQDWSTFQYTGALPETTDYVGGAEGTVFVRQPLVRYSAPLSKQVTLHISAENAETGTANIGSATLNENGDDRIPDFAARLVYAGKMGEFSLAGLARQVRVENAGVAATTGGYGVSAAGKLFLNEAKTGDLRFMATYGHNIGRYVGLNFSPDAVYDGGANKLRGVNVFAALAALRVPLSPQLRMNLMGSYQTVDYDNVLTLANVGTFNKSAWSGAANLFYSPVKAIDLGIEYRHGQRKLVNGADGDADRIEFAAKYSF